MDRSTRQKISKETEDVKNSNQPNLRDIYKTFHQIAAEYKLISRAHGTFSRIGLMLGHSKSLNKFWNIKIIESSPTIINSLKNE